MLYLVPLLITNNSKHKFKSQKNSIDSSEMQSESRQYFIILGVNNIILLS